MTDHHERMHTDAEGVRATLEAYRDALVSSDVDAVVKLYTDDGVTMAPGFPTQVGIDDVKTWYTKCFELVTLDVTFEFKECFVISPTYAFARTESAGTLKQNAAGTTRKEGNQELFVMKRVGGDWKIARYCFNSTNSPKEG